MRTLPVAIVLITSATALYGQGTTGQITGSVTDASGAVIPGATVAAVNDGTGLKREAVTNEQGNYLLPLLPPGLYRVSITKTGFRPLARTNLTLAVDQTVRMDAALELGTVSETVEVSANAAQVDQDTSALGQVIDGAKVLNMPLNGRSPLRLTQLTPNVAVAPTGNGQFQDIPVNMMDDSMISINGGRARSNEVLVDGIPTTTGFVNVMTTVPNVDSTHEFKVQSNNLSAEWGRFGGGVINVSTRSGTNELHGALFEFLRNDAFDANEFFNRGAGRAIPPFRMNQFGYAVGGPIFLPKLYDGRNRSFFFTDYQGSRWRRGQTFRATVPTALQSRGDFSGTLAQNGQTILVYDPVTTRPNPAQAGRFLRDAFPGNVIPASRFDPVARAMNGYYPAPNTPGDPLTQNNNYISNAPIRIDQANVGNRLDHYFNQAWRMFGRVSLHRSTIGQPDTFGNIGTPGGLKGVGLNNASAGMDHTVTLNASSVFNVRAGFARFFWTRQLFSEGFDATQLGLPASLVRAFTTPLLPEANIEGFASLSGSGMLRSGQNGYSLLTSYSRLAGRHSWKTGFEGRAQRLNVFNLSSSSGTFGFTRAMTRGPDPNVVVQNAGVGFGSFLLGAASTGQVNIASGHTLQNFYYAGYVQDDIRVNRKLTLNLGFRYETETPFTEKRNQFHLFDPALPSPVRNAAFPNLNGGLVYAGKDNRQVYRRDGNNFAPRFGFAFSPFDRTVIRGGGGLFFAPFGTGGDGTNGAVPDAGFSSTSPMVASLDGLTPFRFLRDPFPDGLTLPTRESLGARTFLGQSVNQWDPVAVTPYTVQWNLDIQRAFGKDLILDAAYSANRGVKLNQVRQANALSPEHLSLGTGLQTLVNNPFFPNINAGGLSRPTVARQQLLLPYPQYTGVSTFNSSSGNSIYHSLAVKLEKRASNGVGFLLAYTLSKSIADVRNSVGANGNAQNVGLNTTVQDWYNLRAERAISEIDATHAFAASVVAELPFGPNRRFFSGSRGMAGRVIGGWQLSGVSRSRSGYPLVMTATIPNGGNRPNSTGRSAAMPGGRARNEQVAKWFDTGAFTQPAPFTFGNVSRTLPDVRGPGSWLVDLSLVKDTAIGERWKLQFRAESFNVMNRANFWMPNTLVNSTQFGQLVTTTGLPRVNQVALKLIF
ncbi:MAG: carboxypeptidase regulatory-like domain-containing protein [Acidobacteria bacterium]|nr:carboxypeptidase regulatory-like domain-containing protein [Acidobacteriota bacterium]